MLALPFLLAAAVSASAPPTCPAEADVPALLGVSADTACDCLLGRQRRRVVACLEVDKPGPRVTVLVTLPSGASARSEFPLDGPEAGDIAALKVEDWVVKIGEQALGNRETIRVNAAARAGDDLFIGQEVVTFLVLDGTTLGGFNDPSRPVALSRPTASPGIWRARCARSVSPRDQ
jgi:hypothetical protein